jgi:hypothetical protein
MSLAELCDAAAIAADMAAQGVLLTYHRKALDLAVESMWNDEQCAVNREHLAPILATLLDFGDLQDALDEVRELRSELETGDLTEDADILKELRHATAWLTQISTVRDILHAEEIKAFRGAHIQPDSI